MSAAAVAPATTDAAAKKPVRRVVKKAAEATPDAAPAADHAADHAAAPADHTAAPATPAAEAPAAPKKARAAKTPKEGGEAKPKVTRAPREVVKEAPPAEGEAPKKVRSRRAPAASRTETLDAVVAALVEHFELDRTEVRKLLSAHLPKGSTILQTRARKAKVAKDDPAYVQGARSAYIFFTMEQRGPLVEGNEELKKNVTEVSRILGARWKALSEEEKAPYVARAQADKERVAAAKAARAEATSSAETVEA